MNNYSVTRLRVEQICESACHAAAYIPGSTREKAGEEQHQNENIRFCADI